MSKTLTIAPTQTPIEIALKIDSEGMTTAKALYEFLELNLAHYARWCKMNIDENIYAAENVDFTPFTMNGERNPNPTTDYKITANFAKKLAMSSNSARGNEAKEYFIKVEDALKQTITAAQKPPTAKFPSPVSPEERFRIQEKNSRIRASQTLLRIADNDMLPKEYRMVILSYAAKELSGQELLPLPQTEKTYTATELGAEFGVSANLVGKTANAHGLKADEFGVKVWDKSQHSAKQVPNFRYNEKGRQRLRALLT